MASSCPVVSDTEVHNFRTHDLSSTSTTLPSSSKNSTAIDAIPVELLIEIFLSVVNCKTQKWWMATHIAAVCRGWRDVAINTPHLWCIMEIGHQQPTKLLRLFLERSGVAPLRWTIYCWYKDMTEALQICMPHLHRVVSLTYHVRRANWVKPLAVVADTTSAYCTTMVRTLEIFVTELSDAQIQDLEIPLISPSDIHSLPNLQSLNLETTPYDKSTAWFRPTLTTLWIAGTIESRVDVHDFLLALKNMPLLEDVYCATLFNNSDLPDTLATECTTLPRLQRLRIYDSSEAVATVLDHLIFPIEALLVGEWINVQSRLAWIMGRDEEGITSFENRYHIFLVSVFRKLSGIHIIGEAPIIRGLVLTFGSTFGFSMEVLNDNMELIFATATPCCLLPFHVLELLFGIAKSDASSILINLRELEIHCIQAVEDQDASTNSEWSLLYLRGLESWLRSLEVLSLRGSPTVIDHLITLHEEMIPEPLHSSDPSEPESQSLASNLPFSKLQSLVLVRETSLDGPPPYEDLGDILSIREKAGCPLQVRHGWA